MIAPLPKRQGSEAGAIAASASANSGLAYGKFVDLWTWNGTDFTLGENKAKWVNRFARNVGQPGEIKRAAEAMRRLVQARGGRCVEMTTTSPFLTGIGLSHPIENGFLWHHTLGVPYLPGSSVKGLVRNWAEHWMAMEGNNDPEREVRRIFGPLPKQALAMGALVFFDVLPLGPVQLMAEVMTPHDDGWRIDEGIRVPGSDQKRIVKTPSDWVTPRPIPFLAAAPGNDFLFGFAPARGGHPKDVEAALAWIGDALDWLGAGAKTASGFGRFEDPNRVALQAAEKRRLEEEALKNWMPNVGDFVDYLGERYVVVRLATGNDFDIARPDGRGEVPSDTNECKPWKD